MEGEDSLTLVELMLHADQFCSHIEEVSKGIHSVADRAELRLKVSQCRGFLGELQTIFDNGHMNIKKAAVRGHFRHLIMSLLWAAFWARGVIDRKSFRRIVQIEAGFTYLLTSRS